MSRAPRHGAPGEPEDGEANRLRVADLSRLMKQRAVLLPTDHE